MDLMDLGWIGTSVSDREDPWGKMSGDFYIIGVDTDHLMPVEEQKLIYYKLQEKNKSVIFQELFSRAGHDAFLQEPEWFTKYIKLYLRNSVEKLKENRDPSKILIRWEAGDGGSDLSSM